jgi:hypothetical protein
MDNHGKQQPGGNRPERIPENARTVMVELRIMMMKVTVMVVKVFMSREIRWSGSER